jgi:hypothetical protein
MLESQVTGAPVNVPDTLLETYPKQLQPIT